jgi:hypothetical protein
VSAVRDLGIAAVGDRLRAAGLTARALAAWAGTDRIAALPARLPALATVEPVPAAAALALLVAGTELPVDRARRLPIEELIGLDLVERTGARLRARAAVVPVGRSLLVCDRADAATTPDLVCWPDDSSYHLASALPAARVERWLDLGTGSAFAPLARPGLASQITGVDLNPRAVAFARLGAELSRLGHLTLACADVGAPAAPADLVSCNAPMPAVGPDTEECWRYTDATFFARLAAAIPPLVTAGGVAVIHAVLDALPLEALPGERIAIAYTPAGREPRFGVLWWRPAAAPRLLVGERTLTVARPHLDARDPDDAVAAVGGERSS